MTARSDRIESEHIVIVGGGASSHSVIEALRDAGSVSAVTMVSRDDRLPYFRPYLTKELLRAEIGVEDIDLDGEGWYAQHDVTVRLGTDVTGIDLPERTLATSAGPLAFDQLVLATGSAAASLPVPGADDSLLSIRSAADSLRVLTAVRDGGPVVVIGSGFIGCEAASAIRSLGNDVTMVSKEHLPQQDRLSPVVGELIAGWLTEIGVARRGGQTVESIEHVGATTIVHLADGTTLEAAHVLVASGAKPNVQLAEAAGLAVDGGVLVDSSMRTAVTGVFAIGDIAKADNEAARRALRVEHWGDAETMGRIAGTVLAGHPASWNDVPGFWSAIAGREIKYVAWGDGWDHTAVRRSASGITVWYGRDGVVVGVLTNNHDDDLDVGTSLIRSGSTFPPR